MWCFGWSSKNTRRTLILPCVHMVQRFYLSPQHFNRSTSENASGQAAVYDFVLFSSVVTNIKSRHDVATFLKRWNGFAHDMSSCLLQNPTHCESSPCDICFPVTGMHTRTLFDERVGLSVVLCRSAWASPARTDVSIQAATMSLLKAKMVVIWTLPACDCLQIGCLGAHLSPTALLFHINTPSFWKRWSTKATKC